MFRRIAAGLFALIGAFLLWQGLDGVLHGIKLGSGLEDALLQPPTSLWRILAAGLVLAGGLLGALKVPGGAIVAALGAILFAALPGAMAALGADRSMWIDEAYFAAPLVALAAALVFLKRN